MCSAKKNNAQDDPTLSWDSGAYAFDHDEYDDFQELSNEEEYLEEVYVTPELIEYVRLREKSLLRLLLCSELVIAILLLGVGIFVFNMILNERAPEEESVPMVVYSSETDVTSWGFAQAVAARFMNDAKAGKPAADYVYSSVTGRQYWMSCEPGTNEYVCVGGNNARVRIVPLN